jgi:hypothetical protein
MVVHTFRLGAEDAVTEYAVQLLGLVNVVKLFAAKGTAALLFHRYLLHI